MSVGFLKRRRVDPAKTAVEGGVQIEGGPDIVHYGRISFPFGVTLVDGEVLAPFASEKDIKAAIKKERSGT